MLQDLLQIFHEEAAKKEKFACVSLNWAQAVMQVTFHEQMTGQQVIVEDANEGEHCERSNSAL